MRQLRARILYIWMVATKSASALADDVGHSDDVAELGGEGAATEASPSLSDGGSPSSSSVSIMLDVSLSAKLAACFACFASCGSPSISCWAAGLVMVSICIDDRWSWHTLRREMFFFLASRSHGL